MPIRTLAALLGLVVLNLASAAQEVAVPEPSAEAVRFYWTGNGWYVFDLALSIALPLLIAFSFLGRWLKAAAARIMPWTPLQPSAYLGLFVCLLSAIQLPLAFYRGYIRLHAYGLSNQTAANWFRDFGVSLAVSVVIAGAVIWVPYALMRRFPRAWWAVTGVLVFPFIVLLVIIAPVFIDPLFNEFQPMQDKALEAEVLAVAERAGIDGGRVFEVDMSEKTKAINAYVTGFMDTKRVVLWDTILEALPTDQLLFVVAHEAAHYVLNHVITTVVFLTALCFGGLAALHAVATKLVARFGGRIGASSIADPAAMPLLLSVMTALELALIPLIFAYSRHNEHEADRFALELTRNNRAAAEAFVKLQEENLGYPDPGPVFMLFRGSHPSLAQRIRFANEYKPWETGGPLVYERYFDPVEE